MSVVSRELGPFRWDGVPVVPYKEDGGTHFKGVTRQVLVGDAAQCGAELRYFEIEPGGHSSLERHAHVHAVMIVRGSGGCLVADTVYRVSAHDLVSVPPDAWHQFRAAPDEPLGFLCLVRCERDRPRRPSAEDLASLQSNAAVAAFIRV